MKNTEPDLEERVGPAERPDDPMAAARRKAAVIPLTRPPPSAERPGKTAPPTPDQDGCYYLG